MIATFTGREIGFSAIFAEVDIDVSGNTGK